MPAQQTATYSAVESKRFGLQVYRLTQDEFDLTALEKTLEQHAIDVLIYRVPVQAIQHLHQLSRLPGRYLFADTLVYYTIELTQGIIGQLKNSDLHFAVAQTEDKPLVRSMVDEIFGTYSNHYAANPIFAKQLVLAGYAEWAENFVDSNDKVVFLVSEHNAIVALATCSHDALNMTAEGVLYGVRSPYASRGIYTDIIRYTKQYYAQQGARQMLVSTQIQNFAVQKAWIKEGFKLSHAYYTIHIMPKA